ncbi:MAG: NTPase [Deltaproteobacteria bacterium]|nr:NTPase [Deltaproteobacteria bacterium]MBW2067698.1 NTPase [Deltaproteobacteria bacterium]
MKLKDPNRTFRIFVTGKPGCGKTTLIKKLASLLQSQGISFSGFYTEEIRKAGTRVGFRLCSWSGDCGFLAHVGLSSSVRVGKYGVSLKSIENIAIPAMAETSSVNLFLIDEIGKMECASPTFRSAIISLLDSQVHLVATIPLKGPDFIESLCKSYSASRFTLTPKNRDQVLSDILSILAVPFPRLQILSPSGAPPKQDKESG